MLEKKTKRFDNNKYFKVLFENELFLIVNKYNNVCVDNNEFYNDNIEKYLSTFVEFSTIERYGIVHRIDRDTTGLLIISKNNSFSKDIKEQFKNRSINKEYIALTQGVIPSISGIVNFFIEKSFGEYPKMVVSKKNSNKKKKEVKLYFEIIKIFKGNINLIKIIPYTGRTHQIRVGLSLINSPVLNDPLYNSNFNKSEEKNFGQYLHSHSISFKYKNNIFNFKCPICPEIIKKIKYLSEMKD